MASVSGTAGRFATPAVAAGIRDRDWNIHTAGPILRPQKGPRGFEKLTRRVQVRSRRLLQGDRRCVAF